MKSNGEYDWSFSSVGGTTRVNLTKGEDLLHLDELDQKLWTVLSCPVTGLEIDSRILTILDSDSDGHIHAKDIIRTAKWLSPVINDPDYLLRGDSYFPLSLFNRNTPEGEALFNSARHILKVLKLDQEFISTDNVSDLTAIFKNTAFNGDGIITPSSSHDESIQKILADMISTMGSVKDRNGEDGIDTDIIDRFFTALKDFAEWKATGENEKEIIFPFGENTPKAYASYLAVKEKMDDWFIRSSLASFDSGSIASLDTSTGRIGAICDRNLYECTEEIAACPLAKVNPAGTLSIKDGINPAWKAAFDAFRKNVLTKETFKGDTIDETQWKAIQAQFGPFAAYQAAKKGAEVESLGDERIKQIMEMNIKPAIAALIAKDLEYAPESDNISKVSDLLFIYRDFYKLLNNFITFKDFYTPDNGRSAVFQAGNLYIDQRCCHLCIKVSDMGKHSTMASLTDMFLLYCDCVAKHSPDKMTIVAAVTDGSIDNLREGKNGIFYDRNGMDYDATVTKIIINPISIRQAFWTPYRKIGHFISESLNKFASDKEDNIIEKGKNNIANASGAVASGEQKPAKQPFDVAKFAGLFAMIGMALGTILGFCLDLFKTFVSLPVRQMALAFLGLILVISGPSMIKAWLKLRKRNITPLLNANGWAINSKLLVSVPFGGTLTSLARYPMVVAPTNATKKHKLPWFLTFIIILVIILALAVGVTLYLGKDKKSEPAAPVTTEQVQETAE